MSVIAPRPRRNSSDGSTASKTSVPPTILRIPDVSQPVEEASEPAFTPIRLEDDLTVAESCVTSEAEDIQSLPSAPTSISVTDEIDDVLLATTIANINYDSTPEPTVREVLPTAPKAEEVAEAVDEIAETGGLEPIAVATATSKPAKPNPKDTVETKVVEKKTPKKAAPTPVDLPEWGTRVAATIGIAAAVLWLLAIASSRPTKIPRAVDSSAVAEVAEPETESNGTPVTTDRQLTESPVENTQPRVEVASVPAWNQPAIEPIERKSQDYRAQQARNQRPAPPQQAPSANAVQQEQQWHKFYEVATQEQASGRANATQRPPVVPQQQYQPTPATPPPTTNWPQPATGPSPQPQVPDFQQNYAPEPAGPALNAPRSANRSNAWGMQPPRGQAQQTPPNYSAQAQVRRNVQPPAQSYPTTQPSTFMYPETDMSRSGVRTATRVQTAPNYPNGSLPGPNQLDTQRNWK